MSAPHPFRFGVTLFGAASRQQWIAKVKKVEDPGYSVLQVPDRLGNQFSPILALMAAAETSRVLRLTRAVIPRAENRQRKQEKNDVKQGERK